MGHKPWDRAWRRADKARERNAARTDMLLEAAMRDPDLETVSVFTADPAEADAPVVHVGIGFDSTETLCGEGILPDPVDGSALGAVRICEACRQALATAT